MESAKTATGIPPRNSPRFPRQALTIRVTPSSGATSPGADLNPAPMHWYTNVALTSDARGPIATSGAGACVVERDVDGANSPFELMGNKRKRTEDDGMSRLLRRKVMHTDQPSPMSANRPDPIMMSGLQRHKPENEFCGKCMLCLRKDAILTLLLNLAPPHTMLRFGFPGTRGNTTFATAVSILADVQLVSHDVCCDSCAFLSSPDGTLPEWRKNCCWSLSFIGQGQQSCCH